jgi:hypothetical protein
VGDDQNGGTGDVEVAEQFHDRLARRRVEVAGRLVGQQQCRAADERAGDGRALLLAAGQLVRAVVQPVAEAYPFQGLGRAAAPLPDPDPGVEQAVGDGLADRYAGGEVELLEHEPDRAGPQRRQLPVGQFGHGVAVDAHAPAGRPVEGADQVEQRGLARPRAPDDGDRLAVPDDQRHPGDGAHPARVLAGHRLQHHQRRPLFLARHPATPTVVPSAMPSPPTSTCPPENRPTLTVTTRRSAPSRTSSP